MKPLRKCNSSEINENEEVGRKELESSFSNSLETSPLAADFLPLDRLIASIDKSKINKYINGRNKNHFVKKLNSCLAKMLGQVGDAEIDIKSIVNDYGALVLTHMRDDYISSKILKDKNYYEIDFLSALSIFHERDGIFIDAGANIGNHSLYFASVLKAKVVAFEPQPHNILCIELNSILNGVSESVSIHRCALGDSNAEAVLRMSIEANYGTFSAKPASNPRANSEEGRKGFVVPVRILDEVINGSFPGQKVSIIKIDVEGMEMEVIRGASKIIEKWRPLVACECFNRDLFDRVDKFLNKFDYSPMATLNATPTFIFYCTKNDLHVDKIPDYLRWRAMSDARKNRNFAP